MQDQFSIILRKDQINAGPREFSAEKQMRVRDDDRIRRNVRSMKRLDVAVAVRMMAEAVNGNFGVKFARVIQGPTAMVNKYIISVV